MRLAGRLASAGTAAPAALVALLAACGWAGASGAFATGAGLSISPGILEHTATHGGVGAVEISNTTSAVMTVTLALRPWLQAESGEVSPNRRMSLGSVRASASSFTLAAGASRTVSLSLSRPPAGGSIYGAVEVTGIPHGHTGSSIKLDYRLITDLRLTPTRQRFQAAAGSLVEQGSVKRGTLALAVKNTGNTITPIGGTVQISGSGHSLTAHATAKAIVPGATVSVPLVQLLGSLPRGHYTVIVQLTEAGHHIGIVKHTIYLY